MNLTEILEEIYKNGLQFEIYKEMQKWLMKTIDEMKDENMELRNIKNAVKSIANANRKEAIEAIKALCEEE